MTEDGDDVVSLTVGVDGVSMTGVGGVVPMTVVVFMRGGACF